MKLGLCEKDLRGRLRDNLEWISRNGFAGFQIWKPRLEKEGLAPGEVLDRIEDHRPALVLEVLAFVVIVVSVGMIYLPAGGIILGIGLYLAASIGVPPNDDSSERDS